MQFFQVLFNGVSYGASLALVAVGLTLLFGVLRIVNFAHGVLFMLGAYATYYLTASAGAGYFLGVLGAAILVGLGAALLALVVFRRFHGLLLEGAIAAFMLAIILKGGALQIFGGSPRQVDSPISGAVFDIAGVRLGAQDMFIIIVAAVLMVALQVFISRTQYGRALRAIQQDSDTARLQGIDVDRVTVVSFAISGALAGVAGALIAPEQALLPTMGQGPLLLAFVVIIVGGMGSVNGALLAAIGIGVLQSAVSTYWAPQAATWTAFALAAVILAVRPQGILGHA